MAGHEMLHHKVTGLLLLLHRFVGWFWFCQEDSKERCFHNKWSSNITPAIQSIIQRLFHRHRVCTSSFNKTHSQVCNWIIYIFAGTSSVWFAVAVSVDSLHAVFVVRIHSRFFDWFWTKLAYEFLFRASCALALMRSELLPKSHTSFSSKQCMRINWWLFPWICTMVVYVSFHDDQAILRSSIDDMQAIRRNTEFCQPEAFRW